MQSQQHSVSAKGQNQHSLATYIYSICTYIEGGGLDEPVDCPVAALAKGDETGPVRMDVNWPTDQSNGLDCVGVCTQRNI